MKRLRRPELQPFLPRMPAFMRKPNSALYSARYLRAKEDLYILFSKKGPQGIFDYKTNPKGSVSSRRARRGNQPLRRRLRHRRPLKMRRRSRRPPLKRMPRKPKKRRNQGKKRAPNLVSKPKSNPYRRHRRLGEITKGVRRRTRRLWGLDQLDHEGIIRRLVWRQRIEGRWRWQRQGLKKRGRWKLGHVGGGRRLEEEIGLKPVLKLRRVRVGRRKQGRPQSQSTHQLDPDVRLLNYDAIPYGRLYWSKVGVGAHKW